jgi:tetratricopeptide (TPR) repeat protein
MVLGDLGDADQAIVQYEKALELVAHPEGHVRLGVLLVGKGNRDEAIRHYEQALVLDADHVDAHYNLGVELGKAGRHDEAAAHYREVLRVAGDHAEAANNLGAALLAQGKAGEAIGYFELAVRLSPEDVESRANLATALHAQGRVEDAVSTLQEGLAESPEAQALANLLAWVRATSPEERWRDGAEAVQLAERACELTDHSDANYLDTLAAAYAEAGRFADAVRTAKRAVELAADSPERAAQFRGRLALYEDSKPYRER